MTWSMMSIDQGIHYGKKINLQEMEKEPLGFRINKIWQILKHFAGTFHQA